MRYFLIDYENTTKSGLSGMSILNKKDNVVVFYNSTSTIPIDLMIKVANSEAKFEWITLEQPGTNALDLQLIAYLGSLIPLIRESKECVEVFIVSKDNGYSSAIELAANRFNVRVQKITSIGMYSTLKGTNIKVKYNNQLYKNIEFVLRNHNLDEFISYTGLIENIVHNSNDYSELNNKLLARFGEDGNDIYFAVKAALEGLTIAQICREYNESKYDFNIEFNEEEYEPAVKSACAVIESINSRDLSILDNIDIICSIVDYTSQLIELAIDNDYVVSQDLLDKFDTLTSNLLEKSKESKRFNIIEKSREVISDYDRFYEDKLNLDKKPEVSLTEDVVLEEVEQQPATSTVEVIESTDSDLEIEMLRIENINGIVVLIPKYMIRIGAMEYIKSMQNDIQAEYGQKLAFQDYVKLQSIQVKKYDKMFNRVYAPVSTRTPGTENAQCLIFLYELCNSRKVRQFSFGNIKLSDVKTELSEAC